MLNEPKLSLLKEWALLVALAGVLAVAVLIDTPHRAATAAHQQERDGDDRPGAPVSSH